MKGNYRGNYKGNLKDYFIEKLERKTMEKEQFSRTALLIGEENIEKLQRARVAVFGIGGVGGYVVEALARSGVGTLDIIDKDTVELSNLNRQIIATHKSLGRPKVEVAKERILDINPEATVNAYQIFYLPETADQFDFKQYDYVVDAIDTVTGKIALIEHAKFCGVPVISSMGAGNKMDPTAFRVADISKTKVCPLAKVMRRELKKRNIEHVKVVYSEEEPIKLLHPEDNGVTTHLETVDDNMRLELRASSPRVKQAPGSNAFVPSVAGLIIAGEVIKDLI